MDGKKTRAAPDHVTIYTDSGSFSVDRSQVCDDILSALNTAHDVKRSPDLTDRDEMWAKIFTSWDLSKPIIHPGGIPDRIYKNYQLRIGCFRGDVSCMAPGEEISLYRKAGVNIYMRAIPDFNKRTIKHAIYDEQGDAVNTQWAWCTLWPKSLRDARAAANLHWDKQECVRVSTHNRKLAVYWGRLRLSQALQEHRTRKTGQGASVSRRAIDMKELVPFRKCSHITNPAVQGPSKSGPKKVHVESVPDDG
ncbi:hypothetical protein OQA88_12985 [Cercophora sp. LCS_1]